MTGTQTRTASGSDKLLGRAALVTGEDRGFGAAICRSLAAQGADVAAGYGEMGNIGQVDYAAAKTGLFGLTKTLAREAAMQLQRSGALDEVGVTVDTVTPHFIETEMLASVPEKVPDGIRAKVPPGRLGRPEEIARVVHSLAADASSDITGQVWGVNGGIGHVSRHPCTNRGKE